MEEDLGDGDHSTVATIPKEMTGIARLIAKEPGTIAGIEMAQLIFDKVDCSMKVVKKVEDGAEVQAGDLIMELKGKVRSILSTERFLLNVMQRMSGIATRTHKLVAMLEGTETRILDTRKTTPFLRPIEKWAVAIGGGSNHRFGLFDMVMLKDNHIDYSGGIANAVAKTRQYLAEQNKKLRIEVETRTLTEVRAALESKADVIMLDNMDTATMKEAVEIIGSRAETEASGGVTEENLREVAECGVDFISIGALTHSVKSLDISLKAEIN
ncbi:MAG TPA: carboxylating nicotinate-nucleotide diphosphorylase [Cytophagales bacterium]|nr:carboxylating nicotinate-nucleotide diphosphorylase [Cytophagales bacterium]